MLNASEAVVCVAGLAAVTGLIIFSQITKKKEKEKFEEEKDLFRNTHKIDEMIDKASINNEKIEDPKDKALAKDLMMRSKKNLDNASTIASYKEAGDKFLNLYGSLTEGDKDAVLANLLYFKMVEERNEKRRVEEAAEKMQKSVLSMNHQHELDKINATRRMVESFLPDSYTMGQFYRSAAKIFTGAASNKIGETIIDAVVSEEQPAGT